MSDLDDDPYLVAATLGLRVVVPGPRELFLDIDSPEDLAFYREQLSRLNSRIHMLTETRITRSSGGNYHVYLESVYALTPVGRIMLQAILGSDRVRELLSYLRIELKLNREPTLFFEVNDVGNQQDCAAQGGEAFEV
jgi:hypothetical protein